MSILMLTKSRYREDVRVRREAEALAGAGHRVTVIALDEEDVAADGVTVRGIGALTGLRPEGQGTRRGALHRGARWLLLPEHRNRALREFRRRARRAAEEIGRRFDVVHAHDFPALEPAVLLADAWGAAVVYDAHEFWPGMARHGRPEPLRRARQRSEEGRLIRRADLVITVSDGAAALLTRAYGVEEVVVVRNTFPARGDLRPPAAPRGAVYAGRIGPGRDLETVTADEVWEGTGLELHLMGPRDPSYPVADRAEIHESGAIDDVDRLLAAMGVALVPLERGPANHDVALPNKLFEAVAVGVPVVGAALPEMSRLIRETGIGALYEPGDPRSLRAALGEVISRYEPLRAAVAGARADLDWAVDAARLRSAYERVAATPGGGEASPAP